MQTIMIVEDDPVIREELTFLLENENYQVLSVSNFETVPEQVRSACPDLVLLDLGLPDRDGLSLCVSIRKVAPVIVVTSRTSALDELRALNLGSDDYVTKPYNIPVLLARIRAVLRRNGSENTEPDILKAAGLRQTEPDNSPYCIFLCGRRIPACNRHTIRYCHSFADCVPVDFLPGAAV